MEVYASTSENYLMRELIKEIFFVWSKQRKMETIRPNNYVLIQGRYDPS